MRSEIFFVLRIPTGLYNYLKKNDVYWEGYNV